MTGRSARPQSHRSKGQGPLTPGRVPPSLLQAFVDRDAAWEAAKALSDSAFEGPGGGGNSRTNTLYFIASWGHQPPAHWYPNATGLCSFNTPVPWETGPGPVSDRLAFGLAAFACLVVIALVARAGPCRAWARREDSSEQLQHLMEGQGRFLYT